RRGLAHGADRRDDHVLVRADEAVAQPGQAEDDDHRHHARAQRRGLARVVAVVVPSSTAIFVPTSITAATESMTISITTGMASGAFAPGSWRSPGKKPESTTSATPMRKTDAESFAPGLRR